MSDEPPQENIELPVLSKDYPEAEPESVFRARTSASFTSTRPAFGFQITPIVPVTDTDSEPIENVKDSVYIKDSVSIKDSTSYNESVFLPDPTSSVAPPLPSPSNLEEEERSHSFPFALPDSTTQPEEPQYIQALPPVDRGYQAWSFLAAACIMEMLIWGMPFSIGVLHEYWINTLFQGQGESQITLAATLQTGLLYMSTAAFGPISTAYPAYMKKTQVVCLLVAAGSLIASAFATKPWHLMVSLGLFYPWAGAAYMPCATILFEWFHARRGMASGIQYAGTGLGGAIYPLIVGGLLNKFGYKATMISLGLGVIIIGCVCLIFIKHRVPIAKHVKGQRRMPAVDMSFLRRYTFWSAVVTIGITSSGGFIPSLWLPTFAKDLNLNSPGGTGLISILNAASILGYPGVGFLSDRFSLVTVTTICCVGSALSCFFLWGFGTTNSVLVAFAFTFGLFAPSLVAVWSRMISVIVLEDPVLIPLIFGIFSFIRGVGNFASGPISDKLLKITSLNGVGGAYGVPNYGVLMLYTGVTCLAGTGTILVFRGK